MSYIVCDDIIESIVWQIKRCNINDDSEEYDNDIIRLNVKKTISAFCQVMYLEQNDNFFLLDHVHSLLLRLDCVTFTSISEMNITIFIICQLTIISVDDFYDVRWGNISKHLKVKMPNYQSYFCKVFKTLDYRICLTENDLFFTCANKMNKKRKITS